MPYSIRKIGSQFCVVKTATGKRMGCHPTREKAQAQLAAIEANEYGKSLSVYKDADGIRHMVIVSSNSYKDREAEYIGSDAIKGYVDSQWAEDGTWKGDNVLMFWHDGPAIGEIEHADMEGPFLFEVARERQSGLPVIQHYTKAIWDYIENNPNENWGASIGFGYLSEDKKMTDDGPVYNKIRKFETSILPVEWAANAYTVSGVVTMTQQRDEKLNEIMPGWGDKLRAILGLEKGKLDKAGIEHKALGPQITKQDFADAVELAVKMIAIKADEGDDVDIKAEVQAAVDELMTVPQVDLETAGDILQVDDKPEADTAEPDAEPVEDAAAHEHEHEAVEPDELEKALTKNLAFNEQLITDQKALVEVLTEIAGEFKALKELTGLTPKVEALETAIKAMQGEFKQRPRASRANETLADPDAVREMTKDTETTMLWGHIPTKSE